MTRRKRQAEQPTLPGTKARYRPGRVERAAVADITELDKAGRLPAGSAALADSYKLLAREVDRAELEEDRWGKAKVVSEMRAVWAMLVADGQGDAETIDEFVASLPTAAAGDQAPA